MGYKKKKAQDNYKGLGRNNQDRETCVGVGSLFCFVLFFSENGVNIRHSVKDT